MEAKLATMAKRKPVDEDYVPGQGTYSGSGTASPLPEGVEGDIEMDGEAPIGQEEGGKAAQDLEKELEADFRGGDDQMDDGDEGMTETSAPTGASGTAPANGEQGKKIAPSPSLPTIAVSNTSLPPRPPIPAKAVALELATDPEAKAREEAIKRGLAGLPKKPVF